MVKRIYLLEYLDTRVARVQIDGLAVVPQRLGFFECHFRLDQRELEVGLDVGSNLLELKVNGRQRDTHNVHLHGGCCCRVFNFDTETVVYEREQDRLDESQLLAAAHLAFHEHKIVHIVLDEVFLELMLLGENRAEELVHCGFSEQPGYGAGVVVVLLGLRGISSAKCKQKMMISLIKNQVQLLLNLKV